MRVFVTGATGFLGSHFIKAATAAGHDVAALRRPGSEPRITLPEDVNWIEKPLDQIEARDCRDQDVFLHFSAQGVSPQKTTWLEAYRHNVLEQLHALLTAAGAGIDRFVICGTCFEYGPTAVRFERIPPSAPLHPIGAYATSKAVGSFTAAGFATDHGVRMAYLRVFHAFGPGQHPSNFWPSLRTAALTGSDFPMTAGQQVRDFVRVEDVAQQFLDVCVTRSLEPGKAEFHNIGSGSPTTLLAFAQEWWRRWNAKGRLLPGALPYRQDEVMRYVPELTL